MSNLENKINWWHTYIYIYIENFHFLSRDKRKIQPPFMHTQTDYNVLYRISCYDEGIDTTPFIF